MLQSREYVSTLPRLYGLNRINPAEDAMASIYKASYVSLHVRKSNRAALSLYRDSLGFTVQGIERSIVCLRIFLTWYPSHVRTSDADGEDAYAMRLSLKQ
jgi:ribosomal protein S18 acetylase RimI-like enzyme